jgi:hypothetical protein
MPMPPFRTRHVVAGALIALGLPGSAAAQRDRSAVGAQLGYARSWIRTNDPVANDILDGRQGAFIGLFFRRRVHSWVSLQPEVDFTIKGGDFERQADPVSTIARRSLELGYLEVPLLVRIAPPYRRNHIRPVVFAGASAGFQIGCSIRTDFAGDSIAISSCDALGNRRTVETSWLAGAGVQWETAGVSIALEGRFNQAFTAVFATDPSEPRNQLLAILLVLTL